ncbi:MAG TPA: hypothetical protein VMM36_06970 [Opitutaceae bacterium]|nr:hypothetical protein [Opitutaceae bacterium]
MNRIIRFVAPLLALFAAGIVPAFSQATAPVLPAIVIQQVSAEDSDVYATLLARNNEITKEKLGFENYFRIYLGVTAGMDTGELFVVTAGESFATLSKNTTAVFALPDLIARRGQLDAVRTLGPQTSWKAVRWGGTHKGAWIYNSWVNVSDEAAYLAAIDELRGVLNGLGFQDCHMNVYRAVAGRSEATHFVSVNTPSAERLAANLDAISNDPTVAKWFASSAKLRTVVRNGTYREITQ